jgi:thiol-disulfide isomerase/thioredoxin
MNISDRFGLLLLTAATVARAQFLQPGDAVADFTLVNRATRQPVTREEFAGKIVFLEWFAWWCPFCQAAAPQVVGGIDQWYRARGGNPDGLPVLHVAVNLQGGQETQTQNFVTRAGLGLVLEDFNRALANRFQSGGQPIFAVINGVAGSPSHRQWELLAHQDGYGTRDFTDSLRDLRAKIDAVKKPVLPPELRGLKPRPAGGFTVDLVGEPGRPHRLEMSDNLRGWTTVTTVTPATNVLSLELTATGAARFFRVVRE